jgi:prepilin-type N-terminal cleavage/methylation domain-containing protein
MDVFYASSARLQRRCEDTRSGFTLIELIIAFTLIGVLTVIALPRFIWLRDNIAVHSAANDTEALLATARHLAITRAERAVAEIDTFTRTITIRSGLDTVRRRALGEQYGVHVWSSRPTITYSPVGAGVGVSNLSLILSKGECAETLTISRLGRIKR